jgi:hypothetical protein
LEINSYGKEVKSRILWLRIRNKIVSKKSKTETTRHKLKG